MNEKLFGGSFAAAIGKKIHVAEVKKPGGDDETIQVIQFDINAILDESQIRHYRTEIADHIFASISMCFESIDFGEQTESVFTLSEIMGVSQERSILTNVKWKTLKITRSDDPNLVAAKLSCEAPYVEEHFLELARFIAVKAHFTLTKIQGELDLESKTAEGGTLESE